MPLNETKGNGCALSLCIDALSLSLCHSPFASASALYHAFISPPPLALVSLSHSQLSLSASRSPVSRRLEHARTHTQAHTCKPFSLCLCVRLQGSRVKRHEERERLVGANERRDERE